MRASVVSAPTPTARTCRKPLAATVPAYTRSPSSFSAGSDSPVMVASSTLPTPPITSPSTGTRAPFFTSTVSPGSTSAAPTSTCSPSRRTTATSGATFTSSASAARVLSKVAPSSAFPSANRNVTAAASQTSPITSAPPAAMVTRRSMLTRRVSSARYAFIAMGTPATTAAATISRR